MFETVMYDVRLPVYRNEPSILKVCMVEKYY